MLRGPRADSTHPLALRADLDRRGSPWMTLFAMRVEVCSAALVMDLCARRGPTAIARRIRAIVVGEAIQCQPRRAASHVTNKGGEAVRPRVAHGDTASAVVGKIRMPRICAALLRGFPGAVLDARRQAMRCGPLTTVAAATNGPAHDELESRDDLDDTAGAAAAPLGVTESTRLGAFEHRPSSKGLSANFKQRRHPRIISRILAQANVGAVGLIATILTVYLKANP